MVIGIVALLWFPFEFSFVNFEQQFKPKECRNEGKKSPSSDAASLQFNGSCYGTEEDFPRCAVKSLVLREKEREMKCILFYIIICFNLPATNWNGRISQLLKWELWCAECTFLLIFIDAVAFLWLHHLSMALHLLRYYPWIRFALRSEALKVIRYQLVHLNLFTAVPNRSYNFYLIKFTDLECSSALECREDSASLNKMINSLHILMFQHRFNTVQFPFLTGGNSLL